MLQNLCSSFSLISLTSEEDIKRQFTVKSEQFSFQMFYPQLSSKRICMFPETSNSK